MTFTPRVILSTGFDTFTAAHQGSFKIYRLVDKMIRLAQFQTVEVKLLDSEINRLSKKKKMTGIF